jgi:hypothetical protein
MSENKHKHGMFVQLCKYSVLVLLASLTVWCGGITNVDAGKIGVRYNNWSGINQEDLEPGLHWNVIGIHRTHELPSDYKFLSYVDGDHLEVRTVDNNILNADVTIPLRIKHGEAWKLVDAGNHIQEGDQYKFMRLADQSIRDAVRDHLGQLRSERWYNSESRLLIANGVVPTSPDLLNPLKKRAAETNKIPVEEVTDEQVVKQAYDESVLAVLNETLAQYNVEADEVLIRSYYFRQEYEQQLARIQYNEQSQLLNDATSQVKNKQQVLDNYEQGTEALVNAQNQDWERRLANLDRAYQVGVIDTDGDSTPGAARRKLESLTDEEKAAHRKEAARLLDMWVCPEDAGKDCNPTLPDSGRVPDAEAVTDDHLIGIKNIEAETSEYFKRITSEAEGIKGRLSAEGDAKVAEVRGEYDSRLNRLLASPGGRAYVAYNAAKNVKFSENLRFQSDDGQPWPMQLRKMALMFMN